MALLFFVRITDNVDSKLIRVTKDLLWELLSINKRHQNIYKPPHALIIKTK